LNLLIPMGIGETFGELPIFNCILILNSGTSVQVN
jgi:predicted histidine transporter YuiF (NhaC family)